MKTTRLKGVTVTFDPSGALILPELRVMVVSDLHFEKGSSYARKGVLLPPYDTTATLRRLAHAVERYSPQKIISLGDAFHDEGAEDRMSPDDMAHLSVLCGATEWVWVFGNHDPHPPRRFKGRACYKFEIGGLVFVHEPGDVSDWSVAGHLHPCAVALGEGRRLRRPCFITDGTRLVMPPFGAFTGGLNVLDPAVGAVFPGAFDVYMMGRERVYQVPRRALRAEGRSFPTSQVEAIK
ncbi:MAG: ligase-associated DNA damage response endonuclease PdeM [Pseudomonadota bacterium]